MLGRVIGIEIGNNTTKLIEVSKKGTSLKVERFSLIDTPKDCIVNGTLQQVDPIFHAISKEITLKKFKAKKAIILVQSSSIIIRNITMNKQPEKVIRQLIALRPEEYLPVDTSQYQIDFKIVKEFEQNGEIKLEILLVAAPNTVVLPMVNLVERLKLTPVQMSIPSQALEKVFNEKLPMIDGLEGSSLIIDIGGKTTTVTIVAQDNAVLTRMIEFGVDMVNEIAENSFVNLADDNLSVEMKAEYQQYRRELIRPQIEYNVIAELERILQFYYSRFENRPIRKAYLIGGGAHIEDMKAYIKDSLNISTKVLSEFRTVVSNAELEFEHYSHFFVNLLGAVSSI